ncbi:MAG: phosphotransferase, partial [Candidatus Auribacterota bacterium]|nr:phosphotransferase [Candidatus Auribacterota bacterium]
KKDLRILLQRFSDICGILEREPKVVTHRDYHSRNIFLKDGKIYVLDFQDARLGPRQYDLCSLLRDSYFPLPSQSIERLIYYYLDKSGIPSSEFARFFKIFDIMSFQRNLKAAGTFGYMSVIKNKKTYAKYLPRTFDYIWDYSSDHDELKEAAEILKKYINLNRGI